MGGAGKTPHVMHLARWLSGEGRRVAILSRGYGRRGRGVGWVSDGKGKIVTAAEGGDEPVLMARSLPGIPVGVGESRAEAGRVALPAARGRLPPRRRVPAPFPGAGLRSPPGRLRQRAGEPADRAAGRVARAAVPRAFRGRNGGDEMPDAAAGERLPAPCRSRRAVRGRFPGWFPRDRGTRRRTAGGCRPRSQVFAFSGLARNGQFRDTLEARGIPGRAIPSVSGPSPLRSADMARIARESAGLPVVTTEKDLVRSPDTPFPVGALARGGGVPVGWEELSRG